MDILGSISKHGTARFYFPAPCTTINGLIYVQLLQKKLNIHMVLHNNSIFMHNEAPCHRSKVVLEYYRKIKVEVLDWSGNNPDLNLIENL